MLVTTCFAKYFLSALLLFSPSLPLSMASPETAGGEYTAFDDASWAIVSTNLSSRVDKNRQSIYDEFIRGCHGAAGDQR